jgi:predicted membrane protein DUF2231
MDLPKHPVIGGHPVHAMLSDGPIILIPVAVVAAALQRARRDDASRLGDLVTASAAGASLAAVTVGWIDWLTIPATHPVRTPATIHGLINSAVALAVVAAVPTRRRRLGLLSAAAATVVVGAWIGGDLVFRHGWRVHPAEVAEIVEERSDDAATAAAFADARREVAEFEREQTFLPPA